MPGASQVNRSACARSNGTSRKRAETTALTLPPSLCDLRHIWIQSYCHDDRLPPKEMTVSDTVNDEPITCASCEYRYPRSVGVCAMCGTPAPAIEPLQALSAIPDEFGGADHEASVSRSDSQQKPPKPWLRRLIPIITVSIAMILFAWFSHEVRERKLPKESGPAAELTRTLEQPKPEIAGPRHIVHNSARGVQHLVAAKLGTAGNRFSERGRSYRVVECCQARERTGGSRTCQPLLEGRGSPPELRTGTHASPRGIDERQQVCRRFSEEQLCGTMRVIE